MFKIIPLKKSMKLISLVFIYLELFLKFFTKVMHRHNISKIFSQIHFIFRNSKELMFQMYLKAFITS